MGDFSIIIDRKGNEGFPERRKGRDSSIN